MSFREVLRFEDSGESRRRGKDLGKAPDNKVMLIDAARVTLTNVHDWELQRIMKEEFLKLPESIRPSKRTAWRQLVQMLEMAGQELEPRKAAMMLARAGWDYSLAVQMHIDTWAESNVGEWEEDDEEQVEVSELDRRNKLLRLNPGIDRSIAQRYTPDESKLVIHILLPGGEKKTYDFPEQPVNWQQSVSDLNEWRDKIFRRHFGGVRSMGTRLHQSELNWLFKEHLRFRREKRAKGLEDDYSGMNFGAITESFNQEFAGKTLPGIEEPRPLRTMRKIRKQGLRVNRMIESIESTPETAGPQVSSRPGGEPTRKKAAETFLLADSDSPPRKRQRRIRDDVYSEEKQRGYMREMG